MIFTCKVEKCKECPVLRHRLTSWHCGHKDGPDFLSNADTVHPNCPLENGKMYKMTEIWGYAEYTWRV